MKRLMIVLAAMLTLCIGISAAEFTKNRTYENNFSDVAENAWYAGNVASVYEIGLMEGVSDNKFDTESEISVAQAITIAARLHSIYNDTEIPDVAEGRWFQKYVDYGVKNGIFVEMQFDSYSRSIMSYEMVQLFAAALPDEHFPAINDIKEVHDVPALVEFNKDVLLFYNAGILNGNDETGTFLPMSAITRKRAAVILSRTALFENRLKFTLEPVKEEYTPKEFLEMLHKQTVKNTLDDIVLVTYGDYKVTAAKYRYYSFVTGGDKEKIDNIMKQDLSLEKLIMESDMMLSRDMYENTLAAYYQNRSQPFGGTNTYFDALDSQNLTDASFVDVAVINDLSYYASMNEISKMSAEDVYNYAVENDYIYASHILISNETEDAYRIALEARLALLAGEDFQKLVDELGEDPGMKSREGGYFFTYGMMVEPFEKASYALTENEISGIVESDFGYHIIKRLPFDKDTLAKSPDYPTIAANAGSKNFFDKWDKAREEVSLEYIENFDGLAGILG